MVMFSRQTPRPAPPAGNGSHGDTQIPAVPWISSRDLVQFSLHLLGYRNVTKGQEAFADLFCSFLWGVSLCPLLSQLGSCPGWGPTS